MKQDSSALSSAIPDERLAEVEELRARIAELEAQVNDYRRLAERLGELPKGRDAEERPFFPALAETLAKTLNANFVVVGELCAGKNLIRTPAIFARGVILVGDEYELAGTPCENVVGKRDCVYTERVREIFPQDKTLVEWGVESYVGTPLFDSQGAPLGLLAAMWSTPLADPEPARTMLSLFANRAAREIERVRADEALRTSEARFRTLCEASPMGVFESDERGFCTYISTQWEELMKRPNEQLLGFGWSSFVHPDDIQRARAVWREASSQRRPYLDEFRIVLEDGEVRWARAMAKRLGDTEPPSYVGCVEDVTDRKNAELNQRASEERFRAFMDNSPAIAFMKDSDGRRVYANLPYLKRFQRGSEDVIGKTDYEMFDADLARKLALNDERVMSQNRCVQTIEAVPTADGVMHHWLVYKFPVEAGSGDRYIGGVAVDITDRLNAEERLRKVLDGLEKTVAERTSNLTSANARLQREILERESADTALQAEQILLRRLLYRQETDRKLIAYELHDGPVQYVTAALMHLETARDTLGGDAVTTNEAFTTALELLRNTISESRRMINGLQPMLLDESGLAPAIECLINDHYDARKITFEHQMRTERLTPLMEGILFRICQEALTNATKYSQSTQIRIRLTQEHAWVRLEVVDQGIGFDTEQAAAANSFGLRGIRERARLLGGHAMIDSAPGRGTRVAVELPVTEV
ncbi:MAG TPA: PAS domain S-box protein [Pirellulales bacterium]|jgi:PAS domain S-box-containing protein